MKVSIEWLNDYTPVTIPAKTLCDGLTLSGSKVESCDVLGTDIQKVVTGRIISIEKHPDADKLVVCQLDTGNQKLQIVTGATNVHAGDIVPVALDGATLPGGVIIRRGLLRGQQSDGMLCSVAELGCTVADFPEAAADGIFVLPAETPVGQDVVEYLHLLGVDAGAREGAGRNVPRCGDRSVDADRRHRHVVPAGEGRAGLRHCSACARRRRRGARQRRADLGRRVREVRGIHLSDRR